MAGNPCHNVISAWGFGYRLGHQHSKGFGIGGSALEFKPVESLPHAVLIEKGGDHSALPGRDPPGKLVPARKTEPVRMGLAANDTALWE